jgi:hypothetical protein
MREEFWAKLRLHNRRAEGGRGEWGQVEFVYQNV